MQQPSFSPDLGNAPHVASRPVAGQPALAIAAKQLPTALLARLIQEVQNEAQPGIAAYNRMHNRHNRGR